MMQKADKTIKALDSSLMEAELIHAFGKSASNKLRAIGLVATIKHKTTPTTSLHPVLRQTYNDILDQALQQVEKDKKAQEQKEATDAIDEQIAAAQPVKKQIL